MSSLLEVNENTFDDPITYEWLKGLGWKTVDPGSYLLRDTMVHVEIKQHIISRMISPVRVDDDSAWIIGLLDVSFNGYIKTKMEYFDFLQRSEDFVMGLCQTLQNHIILKNSIYGGNGFVDIYGKRMAN